MACNMSATLLVPLVVSVLFVAGAQADASEFPPPVARRAGPVPPPPPPPATSTEKDNCPMTKLPSVVDACRRPPGLTGCIAQCIAHNYGGGHCDILPNGRLGDCTCMNCLGIQA